MIVKDSSNLVVAISTLNDIDKIDKDTKYINIDITNPNHDIIAYFIEHGEKYKYSDITNNNIGYTYVDYDKFVKAENIIDMIYSNMPNNLNDLETAKYLYVSLAKCISFDINTDITKCELYDLSLITNVNNLWGSLALGRVTDITASKLYYYLCRRIGIESEIGFNYDDNSSFVKLNINNQVLLTDISADIPFIVASMQTRHFATYNDDMDIDKKIKYLKNRYTDYYLDKVLKNIPNMDDSFIWTILLKTQEILDINNIKPMELSIIYKYIFNKYASNYDIKISNLFLNNSEKNHFIVISYDNKHYSYNYKEKSFVTISDNTEAYRKSLSLALLFL